MPSEFRILTSHRRTPVFRMILMLCIGIVPFLAACQSEIRVDDDDVQFIKGDELRKLVDQYAGKPDELLIIDPRAATRFAQSHIAGAVNIPLPEARSDDFRLRRARRIVVYGGEFEDPLAKAMTKKVLSFGYSDTKMYIGGLREWQANGWPTSGAEGS